ncbi:MAG: hypothetical protein KJN95_11020 [Gammaproteobacteria bacterium]|nr:hypothetical protein [Gammaproteobacteria bacterium]
MKLTKPLLITKLKATGIHISLSLVVFIYLAYQIYYNWYPQPYFSIDGGWQGIRLVAGVDLVLGPLLTFLIFDLRKSRKEILFDLMTIVTIQFGALAYGIYATYSQRPVAIVVIDDYVLTAIMEHYGGSLSSESVLKQYSDEKPPIIYAHLEQTSAAFAEANRKKVEEKIAEQAQLNLYRPQSELKYALQERQQLADKEIEYYKATDKLNDWLQQNQKTRQDVLFVRFAGRYGAAWLVFDLEGKYLSYF